MLHSLPVRVLQGDGGGGGVRRKLPFHPAPRAPTGKIASRTEQARSSIKVVLNRPFASSTGPLYQNELKCSAFHGNDFSFLGQLNSFSQERLCSWPHFENEGFWDSVVCEQALLFGRAKQAARERASERQSREEAPALRFRVSSRVPLARLLFTISPNGELARRIGTRKWPISSGDEIL